jgi:hypothetical protein
MHLVERIVLGVRVREKANCRQRVQARSAKHSMRDNTSIDVETKIGTIPHTAAPKRI